MPPISVPAARSLTGESRVMPPKVSTSPATGAVPPQFAGVDQLSFAPAPLHVSVAASVIDEVAKETHTRSRAAFRDFFEGNGFMARLRLDWANPDCLAAKDLLCAGDL